jgi:hypothetical protein
MTPTVDLIGQLANRSVTSGMQQILDIADELTRTLV